MQYLLCNTSQVVAVALHTPTHLYASPPCSPPPLLCCCCLQDDEALTAARALARALQGVGSREKPLRVGYWGVLTALHGMDSKVMTIFVSTMAVQDWRKWALEHPTPAEPHTGLVCSVDEGGHRLALAAATTQQQGWHPKCIMRPDISQVDACSCWVDGMVRRAAHSWGGGGL